MNENAMIVTDENGEVLPVVSQTGSALLGSMPTTSLADFQRDAFMATPNRFAQISARKGVSDSVMHIGNQLRSEDIADHVLTIVRVAFATIPAMDISGHPIYDENGNQKTATYPVAHFAEAPGYWYNGGTMLRKNIEAWAEDMGEDLSDPNLPVLNAALAECGGVRAFFTWKNKRDSSGQKYMSMIFA